jgi:hypothetical protein
MSRKMMIMICLKHDVSSATSFITSSSMAKSRTNLSTSERCGDMDVAEEDEEGERLMEARGERLQNNHQDVDTADVDDDDWGTDVAEEDEEERRSERSEPWD